MTQGQEPSDGDHAKVRNLAAVAAGLLERATAAPAGRAALTLVTGAGAPLKQTMLALGAAGSWPSTAPLAPPPSRSCGVGCGCRPMPGAGSWARATTSRSRLRGTGWRAWRTPPSC